MRQFRFLFVVVLLVFVAGTIVPHTVNAQNPKQTKKQKKRYKKFKKPNDPYEYKKRPSKDHDKDGVPDLYDHCQFTPPLSERDYAVNSVGCPPDTDGDGTYDPDDACVEEPGPKGNKGCPWTDIDGDGIPDKDDTCPEKAGIVRFNGCPDTDRDGVEDRFDKCVSDSGMVSMQGCPRPTEDTDGDGIVNDDDVCPLVPGVVANHGCPEIKPEEQEALKRAFENLLFQTNSDIIQAESYESLNGLASVLINNPPMRLHLAGHTDNQGDDQSNLELSQKRAAATRKYLINKGVSGWRITSEGFGETQPVDTNDTAEGRKHNRRVEMTLKY